jgi:ABC-type lipoprotein release transport system permease subunit
MRKIVEISRTGVAALLLHPLRSVVTMACLLVMLVPHLVGSGIARGIHAEAEASVRGGADLYVSGIRFGSRVPVPLTVEKDLADIDGVLKVAPRIVGSVVLGKNRESAVLVGLPLSQFPPTIDCVEGRLPQASKLHELVVGTDLARRLGLRLDAVLPPFYQNPQGERLSKVVGLFRSDGSLWQANVMLASLETAATVFDQRGVVTDFLVYCRPGQQDFVRAKILETLKLSPDGEIRPRVIGRDDLALLLPSGPLHREGVFNLHFTLLFAVGILIVLVTSGIGLSERRREIGILKATGWQTDEILLRGLVESLFLGVASAALAVLMAFLWLKWANGYWIASVFLPGVDAAPAFTVPFRLLPVPVLLTTVLALTLVMTGTLYSSWRAATVPPMEAMR